MNGVCTRWAVVYKHDQMPIDGNLYAHKSKANKRMGNCSSPEKFDVIEVAVMPVAIAHMLIDAVPNKEK